MFYLMWLYAYAITIYRKSNTEVLHSKELFIKKKDGDPALFG